MDGFARISRPPPSASQPTSLDISYDEINYPTFKLLNRHNRVALSPDSFELDLSRTYRLFAVANSKGWFAAVIMKNGEFFLICSPLSDLRDAATAAKETTFNAARTLKIVGGIPHIVTLACSETRVLVGLDTGGIAVYDSAQLFTPGDDQVVPVALPQVSSGLAIQITSNPNDSEPSLAPLVAVLCNDQRVVIFDAQKLEPQGGWICDDEGIRPTTIAWSPKGKQLALGLRTGDILTFTLADKSTPQKHIPSTASAPLVSLSWLSPGHTFRTSYTGNEPQHHVVLFDSHSSATSFIALVHPFLITDRPQNCHTAVLPSWDFSPANIEAPTVETSDALIVVGDICSTDMEIIGHQGSKWDQKSRDDSALAIPMDKNYEDTILLGLAVDLTATTPVLGALPSGEAVDWPPAPILYAYLNDGTVQAWHVAHSKPYKGMSAPPSTSTADIQEADMEATPSTLQPPAAVPAAPSLFGSTTPSAFSQSSQTPSLFGQSSQTSTSSTTSTPVFGRTSAFGTIPSSPFGQAKPTATFGQTSGFGQLGSTPSLFEQSSTTSTPAFGKPSFGQSTGSQSTTAFGSTSGGGFGAFASAGPSKFGQTGISFGASPAAPPALEPEKPSNISAPEESMMADSMPSFGGLSLGGESSLEGESESSNLFGGGIFGAAAPSPSSSGGVQGTGLIKPATGFGAFSSFGQSKPATSEQDANSSLANQAASTPVFGSTTKSSTTQAFGQPAFGQSAFGQATFGKASLGQPSFGQSSFGTPTFGQSGFGKSTAAATPISGGFGAFAQGGATTFGNALQQGTGSSEKPAWATGGAQETASMFGQTEKSKSPFAPVTSSEAQSPFSTPTTETANRPKSPFAPANGSAFGEPSGLTVEKPLTSATPTRPVKSPFEPVTASSSPEPTGMNRSPSPLSKDSPPPAFPPLSKNVVPALSPSSGGAFAQLKTTTSSFKPATGFGAFGSNATPTSSPFFKAATSAIDEQRSAVTAFGVSSSASTGTGTSVFGAMSTPKSAFSQSSITPTKPLTATPVFGSPTAPGPLKSVFSPPSASDSTSTPVFGSSLKLGVTTSTFPVRPTAAPTKPPATGGFAAFSDAQSGFSALSGPHKSFSDMVKAAGASTEPEQETPMAVSDKGESVSALKEVKANEAEKSPILSKQAEPLVPTIPSKPVESSAAEAPKQSEPESEVSKESERDELEQSDESSEPSESSESEGAPELGENEEPDEPEENEDDESYVSEGFSSDGEVTVEGPPPKLEPSRVPLPPSRSPSAVPESPVPAVRFTPSPTPSLPEVPIVNVSKLPSPTRDTEESTTPPGSPVKQPLPTTSKPPSPLSSAPLTPLGLGRPSTRPARSSPLASAPLSGDSEQEKSENEVDKKPAALHVLKPRPASPKGTFGVLPAGPKIEPLVVADEGGKATRPKTPPPLLSSQAPKLLAAPTAKLDLGLFGKIVQPVAKPEITPSLLTSPSTLGFPSTGGTFPGFGTPTLAKPLSTPAFNLTGAGTANIPQESLFSTPPATKATQPPMVLSKEAPPTPEQRLEEGMQTECAYLCETLRRELEEFRLLAQEAGRRRTELGKSLGGSLWKCDLADANKWGFGDLTQFGRVIKQFEEDLSALRQKQEAQQQALYEMRSNMLRAGTRKEEIARFNKAKTDTDFSKMLKSRTLGPEHLETQTQLRRIIRIVSDRIQKLEDQLVEYKKRLNQMNTGKPALRAPSLDTINRTYRNIDIAIKQQVDDIANLTTRLAKLSMTTPRQSVAMSDSQLFESRSNRAFEVTPNVAVTTAAALNAERSAQRLKRGLLAVRKEPLLNNKAAANPSALITYDSPQKSHPTASAPSVPLDASPLAWNVPEDTFNPGTPLSSRRGTTFNSKAKKSTVTFKRSPLSVAQSPPAPVFEWGPLPSFPPLNTMFTPVTPKKG